MDSSEFDKLLEYQTRMQKNIISETRTDRKIEFLSLINQLTSGPGNIVQKEHIAFEAAQHGFSEKEVDELIDKLIDEGIIFESSPGFIKKR